MPLKVFSTGIYKLLSSTQKQLYTDCQLHQRFPHSTSYWQEEQVEEEERKSTMHTHSTHYVNLKSLFIHIDAFCIPIYVIVLSTLGIIHLRCTTSVMTTLPSVWCFCLSSWDIHCLSYSTFSSLKSLSLIYDKN